MLASELFCYRLLYDDHTYLWWWLAPTAEWRVCGVSGGVVVEVARALFCMIDSCVVCWEYWIGQGNVC